jgi:hypothetical protein
LLKLWLVIFIKFFAGMMILVVFLQLVHKVSFQGGVMINYSLEDLMYLLKVSVVGAAVVSLGIWGFVISESKG